VFAVTCHDVRMIDVVRARPRPGWLAVASAAGAGLVLGLATLGLQGVLPGSWNQLANSGAVWAVGAFLAGVVLAPAGWRPVTAGTGVLAGAVIGYYAGATLFLPGRSTTAALVAPAAWLAVALLAGPLFGTAGAWWLDERRGRRITGPALLGGAFIAEGLDLLIVLHYVAEAGTMFTIGALIPVVLGRTVRDRVSGLLALVPVTGLGLAGYLIVGKVLDLVFRHA
jgi:hypothetical protein